MTQRLPIPGGDDGNWGTILNGFLGVSLNGDGTMQTAAIAQAGGVTSVNSLSPTNGAVTVTASSVGALPTTTKLAGLADTTNAASAANGQVLAYSSTSNTWVPATVSSTTVSNATYTTPGIVQLAGDLGGGTSGTATAPQVTATHLSSALPINQGGTGATTQNFVDLSSNQTIGGTKTFSSTITGNISGNAATATTASSATSATTASTVTTIPALTGDVTSSGSSNATTVGRLQGAVILSGTPSINQVLTATSSSAASWSTPSTGPVYAGDGGTATTVSHPDLINVLDYGATGNGTTDDSTAINAAIVACPAGGTVVLPPTANSYAVASTIVLKAYVHLTQLNGGADVGGLSVIPGSNLDAVVAGYAWYNNVTTAGSEYLDHVSGLTIRPHDSSRTTLTITAISSSSSAPQITTSTPHGLSANQGIILNGLAYNTINGPYNVATIVDSYNFTVSGSYTVGYSSGGTVGVGLGHAIATSSFHACIENNTINGRVDGDGILLSLTTRNGSAISGSLNEWRVNNNRVYMGGDATGNQNGNVGIHIAGSNITDGFIRDNIVSGAGGFAAIWATQMGGTQVSGNHTYSCTYNGIYLNNANNCTISDNYVEATIAPANTGTMYNLFVGVNNPNTVIRGNKLKATTSAQTGNTYYGLYVASTSTAVRAHAIVSGNTLLNGNGTAVGTAIYYDDTAAVGLTVDTGDNSIDSGWSVNYATTTNLTASFNSTYNPWKLQTAVTPTRQPTSGQLLVPVHTIISNGGAMPVSPNSWSSYALAVPVDAAQAIKMSGIDFYLASSGVQGTSGNASLQVAFYNDDGTGTSPALYSSQVGYISGIDPTQATGEISSTFSNTIIVAPKRYWLVIAFQMGSANVAMATMPSINAMTMLNQVGVANSLATHNGKAWLFQAPATGTLGQINNAAGVRWGYIPALGLRAT